MSTRYVWEKFDVVKSYTQQEGTVSGTRSYSANEYKYAGVAAQGCNIDSATGRFSPSGQVIWISANSGSGDASSYPYFFLYLSDEQSSSVSTSIVYINTQHISNAIWAVRSTATYERQVALMHSATVYDCGYYSFSTNYGKGTISKGKSSSASASAYPNNGVNSSVDTWYEYLGSDSVDPLAVTCSADTLHPGDTVQIHVTPASNLYGGTISYQYYVRVGTGSWSTLGSKTTETTKSYTIPSTAQKVQFRALASDDMGFTSTTYVTSAVLIMGAITAYVGVAGKARKIEKIYIGVNGKAREVEAIYVGVNGKARKIM